MSFKALNDKKRRELRSSHFLKLPNFFMASAALSPSLKAILLWLETRDGATV